MPFRSVCLLFLILAAAGLATGVRAAAAEDAEAARAALKAAAALLCAAPEATAEDMVAGLGATGLLFEESQRIEAAGMARDNWRFGLAGGAQLRLLRILRGSQIARLSLEFHTRHGTAARPLMVALTSGGCDLHEGRQLIYDAEGRPERLLLLDAALAETGEEEPLNPPVPPHASGETGGVRVALVDSGVNYLLPEIAGRLARDGEGRALGFDFWDLDDRPFDADYSRSPFFPLRHGTTVASILLREAPAARLVPFRYPRPDMTRLADLVDAAAASGAVVVAMPLGSNRIAEWDTFALAAARHPTLLFVVSAGNDGRDIDQRPVYPASLALDNLLVVTSADDFGHLAEGSNWGRQSVDVMVPGEQIAVIDHRGAAGRASGSSFAVPRVAALAARLKARHPEWQGPRLKAAILELAKPSPFERKPRMRHGWIADPTRY